MAAAKRSTSSTVLQASTPGPDDQQLLPNIKDPHRAYHDQTALPEVHFDVFSA